MGRVIRAFVQVNLVCIVPILTDAAVGGVNDCGRAFGLDPAKGSVISDGLGSVFRFELPFQIL